MKKFTINLIAVSLGLLLAAFVLPGQNPVLAKDFDVVITRDFHIDDAGKITVTETHKITNNSTTEYISKSNQDIFQISHLKSMTAQLKDSVATAKITSDGKELSYTTEYKNESAFLTVDFPKAVGIGNSLEFTLQYQNFGLIEKTGALYDIYISGLSADAVNETGKQSLVYDTNVYINNAAFPEQNFIMPSPVETTQQDNNYTKYYFNQQSLVGQTIWIQRGTKQFYQFKITQQVLGNPSNSNNLGIQDEYKIIIPRDIANAEIYQKVYFDSFSPLPTQIEEDSDGNVFAYFNMPSNQGGEISITGYAEVGVTGAKVTADNSGSMSDYRQNEIQYLLKAAPYWEVDAPEIQSAAAEIKGDITNVNELYTKTYNWVVSKINYSEVKRFGLNERLGALATLKQGAGVCMEYSDLFLTLSRAQGIPAKAVFGYGYDPMISNTDQEAHQWVEVLVPGMDKWLDLDVTWGASGQAAVGGYLNHFYTHVASTGPEQDSEVTLTGLAVKDSQLALPKYQISAVDGVPGTAQTQLQADLLLKYPKTSKSQVVEFLVSIPAAINSVFSSFSDKDKLSVIMLTAGFSILIIPIVLMYRKRIKFRKEEQNADTVTSL